MKKHLRKFLWMAFFALGLFWLLAGSPFKKDNKDGYDANSTEKCTESKSQTGLSIDHITRHILDFNK